MVTQRERLCTARTGWIATLTVGLIKILLSGLSIEGIIEFGELDYSGFAMLLGAVGAVYWGRQDSKRKEREHVCSD